MSEQMLFGGAFSVVLPDNRNDLSAVRQIPDNQEVFAHPHTDQSIIIELMEAVDAQEPDQVAIKTHFDDLAAANGAASDARIIHMEPVAKENITLEEADSCWYIIGEQNIAKFNEAARNTVELHMGLFRVGKFSTDILVTFNDPINIDVASSSHHAVPTSVVRWNTDNLRQVLTSLKLLDPGIFGL
ncbi:ran guanine nucleotide release factor-like [Mercenaria mercenaria]|uniref:ran guanine nucleotide release factor-like n=1 Tax=Mercenaria mercenaria TaxID=6596 RepID=UPI00234F5CAE|nr:ran guanine nucleotide release factor-like [Mercenaria mercenaria]